MKDLEKEFLEIIGSKDQIVIYGAGRYARAFLRLLERYGYDDKLIEFWTTYDNNIDILGRYAVKRPNIYYKDSVAVCVAADKKYHKEILDYLNLKGFGDVINVYKFCEMIERNDGIELKVFSLLDLWSHLYSEHVFNGYNIVIEYMIASGCNENEELKKRYFAIKTNYNKKEGQLQEEKFERLCKFWKYNKKEDYELTINDRCEVIGDSYSFSLSILYKYTYMKARVVYNTQYAFCDENWLDSLEIGDDLKINIKETQKKLDIFIKNYDFNDRVSIVQKMEIMLGQIRKFGTGGIFYQSFSKLDIKGQRSTEKRIQIYQLEKLVKGKKVLDVGCNVGFLDLAIADIAESIDGIEYERALVEIANVAKDYLDIRNVEFECIDFKSFRANKEYDVIFSFAVHEWIGLEAEEYVYRITNMLSEEGFVLFESQAIPGDLEVYKKHCNCFLEAGGDIIYSGEIKDDNKILRKFSIFQY